MLAIAPTGSEKEDFVLAGGSVEQIDQAAIVLCSLAPYWPDAPSLRWSGSIKVTANFYPIAPPAFKPKTEQAVLADLSLWMLNALLYYCGRILR